MQENYTLFYGEKKQEDTFIIKNMFENNEKIEIGWTEKEITENLKTIENKIKNDNEQIIFFGIEIGWAEMIRKIREKHKNPIKVICNTSDALLYYDYERNNFFDLLKLSKENIIDKIGFLKKGQYEVYKKKKYNSSYILENYKLDSKYEIKNEKGKIKIGIYPLNYTWDKNIFNQLSVGKFIDNSIINYNELDYKMTEFLKIMKINSKAQKINEQNIFNNILENDINISCSFTEYLHTIFFLSMELGAPCITGNNEDFLNSELKEYLVVEAEDNPIKIAEKLNKCIQNKEKIMELYETWKKEYNKKAENSIKEFLD